MRDSGRQEEQGRANLEQGSAIVPFEEMPQEAPRPSGTRKPLAGIVWCLVGGLCVPASTVLSCLLIAYGLAIAAQEPAATRRATAGFLVALAAAIGASFVADPLGLPGAIAACCIAGATTLCELKGARSVSATCLLILGSALALIGADSVAAAFEGTTITQLVEDLAQGYAQAATQSFSTFDQAAGIANALDAVRSYWPLCYLAAAGIDVLFAHGGARLGERLSGRSRATRPWLGHYQAPVWVAIAFIVLVAAQVASRMGRLQGMDLLVSNALIAARVVLAIQGIAVVDWLLATHGVGAFGRLIAVAVGIWLETSFVIMTVVGLVDVFADFRGLRKDGGHRGAPLLERKQSA